MIVRPGHKTISGGSFYISLNAKSYPKRDRDKCTPEKPYRVTARLEFMRQKGI